MDSRLRDREFSRLEKKGQIYLDYTGSGLYADSQVQKHLEFLQKNVFGNPHSDNPTSRLSTEFVKKAKDDILNFFLQTPKSTALYSPKTPAEQ